jgi:hypothetical protein
MSLHGRRQVLDRQNIAGTRVSPEQATPEWARGAIIYIDWYATGGVETITPTFEFKSNDGSWNQYTTAFTALAAGATGKYFLLVYPTGNMVPVATQGQQKDVPLPGVWRLRMVLSAGANQHDYDVSVEYLA